MSVDSNFLCTSVLPYNTACLLYNSRDFLRQLDSGETPYRSFTSACANSGFKLVSISQTDL